MENLELRGLLAEGGEVDEEEGGWTSGIVGIHYLSEEEGIPANLGVVAQLEGVRIFEAIVVFKMEVFFIYNIALHDYQGAVVVEHTAVSGSISTGRISSFRIIPLSHVG